MIILNKKMDDILACSRIFTENEYSDYDIIMNYNNSKTKDLHASIDKIKSHGSGIVVLINNPILGDLGQLSQDEKVKYYGLGAQILKNFSITNISVLSNSFSNELDLGIYGLNVSGIEKLS